MSAPIEVRGDDLPVLQARYAVAESALVAALAELAAVDPTLVQRAVRQATFVDPLGAAALHERADDLAHGRRHGGLTATLSGAVGRAAARYLAADRLALTGERRAAGFAGRTGQRLFWFTPPGLVGRLTRHDLALALGGAEGPGAATLRPPGPAHTARPDMAGLYDDVSGVEGEGRILITSVVGPDGVTRWVVSLPGIQSLGSTKDPQDLLGALRRDLGDDTSYNPAVVAAMLAAHVPDGADVMLVGHSYGGMTAVSLASDPRFTWHWNVAAVVTAGSPVSNHAVPPGVPLLTIEAHGDYVPRAEDLEPPTPVRDGRTDLRVPGLGHDLDKVYLPSLSTGSAKADADGWLTTHAPLFLAGTATSTVAVLADKPGAQPQDRALQDRAVQDRAVQDRAVQDQALQDQAVQDQALHQTPGTGKVSP